MPWFFAKRVINELPKISPRRYAIAAVVAAIGMILSVVAWQQAESRRQRDRWYNRCARILSKRGPHHVRDLIDLLGRFVALDIGLEFRCQNSDAARPRFRGRRLVNAPPRRSAAEPQRSSVHRASASW